MELTDTDLRTRIWYEGKIKRLHNGLGISSCYLKVPGSTVARNPERLYGELKSDKSRISPIEHRMRQIVQSIDLKYLQLLQFTNSMHGTGMSVNTILAEEVFPGGIRQSLSWVL